MSPTLLGKKSKDQRTEESYSLLKVVKKVTSLQNCTTINSIPLPPVTFKCKTDVIACNTTHGIMVNEMLFENCNEAFI